MRQGPLISFLLLAACTGTVDTNTDPDGGSGPGTSDDTAAAGADTDDDTSGADAVQISDISWSLHEEIGSIVYVSWQQDRAADVHIAFGLDGEEQLASPVRSREAGAHTEMLLGVPFDAEVSFQIVAGDDVASEAVVARTGPLPDDLPPPQLYESQGGGWAESDRWLLIGVSAAGEGWDSEGYWKLILDRQGRVVWAHETPDRHRTFYMQPSADGRDILWDEDTFWTDFDKGKDSAVHRMKIDGTVLESISVPGLHHAFLELPGQVIVWGGDSNGREVLRERTPDGAVRQIWDCSTYWREHGATNRCDGNALSWNEADDTILFSSDAGHTIVELQRGTGAVLRSWGQLQGTWPFAEGTAMFWKQHSPNITPAGTLLLSSWTDDRNHEILAREYEIDEEEQVLREVWTCGVGSGIIGEYAGEAHRLDSGNTLLNYGDGGHIREYTPACEVLWHIGWPGGNMTGRALFLEDLYAFAP